MAGFFKVLGWKAAAGAGAVAVIIGAISWWQMDPATRGAILRGTGSILAWLAVVALVPWATFFVIRWVADMDSNAAGGVLVAGYTLLELLLLLWLFGWSVKGAAGWTFVAVGGLLAAVYNILICDWIAERLAG